MDSNLDINSIRKTAVSRRGGVRTRGGRLPPIRIGNIPGLAIGSSSKRVFVPKIPQRRVQVKEESVEPVPQPSTNSNIIRENSKQQGRGRGRGKVFLQTEGSFLGEGPALKIKKEFRTHLYDKAAYVSDTPRSKKGSLKEVDCSIIDELLKPYDEEEFYYSTLRPAKFPLVKQKKDYGEFKVNIKKEEINPEETSDKLKINIKQEIIKTETEPFIKQEPKDDYELDSIADKDSSFETTFDSKKDLKNIKLFQEDTQLILLQLPTCLPFIKPPELSNKDKPEKKSSESVVEKESKIASLKDLGDGCIGKLRIMKSGQIRMILGSSVFILEEEVETKSSWKAASISIEDECKGNVAILGKIKCAMSLRPVL